ncbi:claudin-11-like [Oncorhynchus keta]|uniref:claudin-11-like n=1 Tax=Oncorhynchus keta TaxID=8018 RepID=UPI00227C9E5A|nr:claudin-11-like [Oncorhynchus keta]
MANSCLQLSGFVMSCIGWVGILIATATNDWVVTCKYGMNTCKKMDELGAKGLWAECVISTALYHCISLTQILDLPAYIQTSRALMITGSLLGLPAVGMVLTARPASLWLCVGVSTVWFPIGAHQDQGLMSFGFSLYAGWVGTAFCLLGGAMITCCSTEPSQHYNHHDNDRFYYSKDRGWQPCSTLH